jgi:hypothetical protein
MFIIIAFRKSSSILVQSDHCMHAVRRIEAATDTAAAAAIASCYCHYRSPLANTFCQCSSTSMET